MNPKLMTNDELRDVYERMSDADANRFEAHIAVLTAMPEDVARDEYNLRMSLRASLPEGVALTEMLAALSRLASAAARVPGLEKKLEDMRLESVRADSWRDDAVKNRERAERAEAERDAAMTRESDLERRLDDLNRENVANERAATAAESERDAIQRERDNLRELLRTSDEDKAMLRRDRDAARQEAATLRETCRAAHTEVAAKQSLLEVASQDAGRLEDEADALRAKVVELEQQRNEAMLTSAELEQGCRDNHAKWTAAIARAEAAERKHADEVHRADTEHNARQAAERREGVLRSALSVCIEYACMVPVGHLEHRRQRAHSAALAALAYECADIPKREEAPTPAPAGLLEAVGPLIQWARAVCSTFPPDYLGTPRDLRTDLLKPVLTLDFARRLRTAYDAAKGGDMREEGDLAGLLALLARPDTDTLLRIETEGENLFSVDGGELRDLADKARKWGAAVAKAKDMNGLLQAHVNPASTPGEALLNVAAWLLDVSLDTPPSGPGGGEGCTAHPGKRCDSETPGVFECRVTESSGRLLAAAPIPTRARIAPTPTPDVPPLTTVPGFAMPPPSVQEAIKQQAQPDTVTMTRAELEALPEYSTSLPTGTRVGKRWRRNANVLRGGTPEWTVGEYVPHEDPKLVGIRWCKVVLSDVAQPKPAAPEVVMEKDGVRVSEDGSVNLERGVSEWWALGVLGNALVEAKRELRCEHGRDKDYCAKEYEDAQERAARKAAESMRERIKAMIRAMEMNGTTKHNLLQGIGVLPLEDK